MLTKNISFKNFDSKKPDHKILQALRTLKKEKNEIIKSLGKNYKNSFDKKILKKYKKNSQFNIIGMGGSILGARSIYSFLKHKIKKNFSFHDSYFFKNSNLNKKSSVNIISKLESSALIDFMFRLVNVVFFFTPLKKSSSNIISLYHHLRILSSSSACVIYDNTFLSAHSDHSLKG